MDINVDVLIVGSGVSGLYNALNLRKDLKVLIISKTKLTETNTYLAQGGISTAIDKNDIPLFIEDTLKAGKYKNKLDSVAILVKESRITIDNIIRLGVKLDKSNNVLALKMLYKLPERTFPLLEKSKLRLKTLIR